MKLASMMQARAWLKHQHIQYASSKHPVRIQYASSKHPARIQYASIHPPTTPAHLLLLWTSLLLESTPLRTEHSLLTGDSTYTNKSGHQRRLRHSRYLLCTYSMATQHAEEACREGTHLPTSRESVTPPAYSTYYTESLLHSTDLLNASKNPA